MILANRPLRGLQVITVDTEMPFRSRFLGGFSLAAGLGRGSGDAAVEPWRWPPILDNEEEEGSRNRWRSPVPSFAYGEHRGGPCACHPYALASPVTAAYGRR